MALALRAAFGVRVCNPANAVAKRDPRSSLFTNQHLATQALDYSRHPRRSRYAPPPAFAFAILQTKSGLRGNDDVQN
jgi:hypothetical protein